MKVDTWECSVGLHYQMVLLSEVVQSLSNIQFSQEQKCKSFRLNVRLCACCITLLEARSTFGTFQSVRCRFSCFCTQLTAHCLFNILPLLVYWF